MTRNEAIAIWKQDHLPNCRKNDKAQKRESWNNFTDYLCKGGHITEKQYQTWDQPRECK